MSRRLTQEQNPFLDNVRKEYMYLSVTALNRLRKLDAVLYDVVVIMNLFESIYHEVNMYLWDNKDKRYDLHKKYIPLKNRV